MDRNGGDGGVWRAFNTGLNYIYGSLANARRDGPTPPPREDASTRYGPRTSIDWFEEAPPDLNNIVTACITYITRGLLSLPIVVEDADGKQQDNHPALELLRQPAAGHTGKTMLQQFIGSALMFGDGFIIIERENLRPTSLRWVPSHAMTSLRETADAWEGGFLYHTGRADIPKLLDDVIWWRYALDWRDPLRSRSPISSSAYDVFIDQEAHLFAAQTLHGAIGAGGVFTTPQPLTDEQIASLRSQFSRSQGGDRRGLPKIMGGGMTLVTPSLTPADAKLRDISLGPEARIPAQYGVNAQALSLEVGQRLNAFATKREADQDAWSNGILPHGDIIADVLTQQWLWREFNNARNLRIRFDHSKVRLLQDSEDAIQARAIAPWREGLTRRNEAREKMGEPPIAGALGQEFSRPPLTPSLNMRAPASLNLQDSPAERVRAALAALAAARTADVEPPIAAALVAQAERALSAAAAAAAAGTTPTPEMLIAGFADDVGAVTLAAAETTAQGATAAINAAAVLPDEVAVSDVTRLLVRDRASARLRTMTDDRYTKWQIFVRSRVEMDWSLEQIIEGGGPTPPGTPYRPGLREILTDGEAYRNQARTIARTESAYAMGEASANAYAEAGVTHVLISDGDEWDAPCMAANGQTWPIEDYAANILSHPNCTRVASPAPTA